MILKRAVGRCFTIKKHAMFYDVNKYQARKQIQRAIENGNVEKYHNRFYYISDDFSIEAPDIQKKLINKAKINLEISRLINNNYIYDKQFMAFIDLAPYEATIYLPLRKKKITLNLLKPIIDWEYRLILTRNKIKVT